MTYYYAVLWTLLTGAAVFVAVSLIRTLSQVKDTARELELLAQRANVEMDKVGTVTDTVAKLAGSLSGSTGRWASGAFNLVMHLIGRYRGRKSAAE